MFIRDDLIENPTTELFVPSIVLRSKCVSHGAEYGDPCFSFGALTSKKIIHGVCNRRAVKSGLNGRIKEASLRTNTTRVRRGIGS